MRDYGKVVSTFWTRGSGKKLRGDPCAQVLALYLFTCPTSTMTGLYYLALPVIAHETGLSLDDIACAFNTLSALDIAHYDDDADLVWVPEMARYQIAETLDPKDHRVKGVEREVVAFKAHRFFASFLAKYAVVYGLSIRPQRSPFQVIEATDEAPSKPITKAPSKPLPSQDQDQDQDHDHTPEEHAHNVGHSDTPVEAPARFLADMPIAVVPDRLSPPVGETWVSLAQRLANDGSEIAGQYEQRLAAQRSLTTAQRKTLLDVNAEYAARARSGQLPSTKPDHADAVFTPWLDGWRETIGGDNEPKLPPGDKRRMLIADRLAEGYTLDSLVLAAASIWSEDWRFAEKYNGCHRFEFVFGSPANLDRALDATRQKPAAIVNAPRICPPREIVVTPKPVYLPAKLGHDPSPVSSVMANQRKLAS